MGGLLGTGTGLTFSEEAENISSIISVSERGGSVHTDSEVVDEVIGVELTEGIKWEQRR